MREGGREEETEGKNVRLAENEDLATRFDKCRTQRRWEDYSRLPGTTPHRSCLLGNTIIVALLRHRSWRALVSPGVSRY